MTRLYKVTLVAALLWLCLCIHIQFLLGSEGDKAWLLLVARMWLDGKRLYADLFEPNMPLITWIMALPVYVSLHVPMVKDYQALVFLGGAVITASVFLCVKIIRFHPAFADNKQRQMQFALLLYYVLIFYTSPAYFFDREYIFLVLTIPYLLRFMPSIVPAPVGVFLRIITAVFAAVGFCIKPQTIVVFAALQLIRIARERSASVLISFENILIYAIGALYMLAVWQFNPEYFTVVLPMALATYSACRMPVQESLPYAFVSLFTFALAYIDFRPRYDSPYCKDLPYFAAVCAAFLLYALANNGWGYTYNLATSVALIANGLMLLHFLYLKKEFLSLGQSYQAFQRGVRACTLNFILNAVIVVGAAYPVLQSSCDRHCKVYQELVQFVEDNHVHSFGTISLEFGKWTDLSRATSAQWETRFSQLWMLPKFVGSDDNFKRDHQRILEYVANGLAQDLDRNQPQIVFVDDTDNFYSVKKYVSILSYFSAFPDFDRAWQHYQFVRKIDFCDPSVKSDKYNVFKDEKRDEHCRVSGYYYAYSIYRRTP